MPDPKFLYGSHYSTPGYVLYYLVRVGKTVYELGVKFLLINYQLCMYSFKDFFCDIHRYAAKMQKKVSVVSNTSEFMKSKLKISLAV